MARSRTTTFVPALVAALLLPLFVAACGGAGEEQALIRNYFTASRVNDRATLNNIAMVAFNPEENGTISSFSVDSVGEVQSRPLRVRELNQALMGAQQEEETFTAEKVAYQDENFEAINRVLEAERDGEDVAQRDQEVQEVWTDWRNRTMEHAKMVSDAQSEVTRERNAASLSLFDPNNPPDLTASDGELFTKDVSITATVDQSGSESERAMTVTLQMAVLTGADGSMLEGRWVIANFR